MSRVLRALVVCLGLGATACRVSGPVLFAAPGEALPDGGGCVPGDPACPLAGTECSASVHDAITTTGPDGLQYPTWHPAVDPTFGCFFGHEHGDDPATSVADPTPPAFGYVAAVAGRTESHFGYKVFVVPSGGPFDADHRLVFHMGTTELGRYTERYHSLEYDYVAIDGVREFHVQAMADTGTDITEACNQTGQGRSFSSTSCSTTYEIWRAGIRIESLSPAALRMSVGAALGVFDPVTSIDLGNYSALHYTQDLRNPGAGIDPLSPRASFRGCRREIFTGPNIFGNNALPTVYFTDAFGIVQPSSGPGTLRQEVASVTTSSDVFLLSQSPHCAPGVHAPN